MTDKAKKDIAEKVLKEKAQSKPDTTTATACYEGITNLNALDTVIDTVSQLKGGTKIPLLTRKNKYTPRDSLGRLMLARANTFAERQNGAIINSDEMLSQLQNYGATIKSSNKEYVKYTDTVIKKVITLSKKSFEARFTRIRNYIKENYPT